MLGVELQNKYEIRNSAGQQLLKAKEKPGFLRRQFFGPTRDFEMKLTDVSGREVIRLERKSNFSYDVLSYK